MDEIKKLKENYRQVFTQGTGEEILKDLEYRFHIHNTTMDNDINNLAYLEGQRSVILFIKNMLKGENNGRRKPGSGTTTNSV
jgi:hypothetical protein|tara:strand:- start:737 stop:982 length:246 start_codon:yes stop_codon:yes gene_type:complete